MPEHKTVLVTGSSRGLGKSLALVFAQNNYNVIIHGRNRERLEEVKLEIAQWNVECEIVTGDLSSPQTIENLTEVAKKMKIDVLINNAGVYLKKDIADTSEKALRDVIETNLIAPMLLTKRLLKILSWKLCGLVVNINSIAGKSPNAEESVYCASKHGLRGFTTSLLCAVRSVRIIEVYLGAMKTDMSKGREELDNLIDPDEAAQAIFAMIQDYPTLKIREVSIGRKNY